jgi:hypothetical protein
VTTNHPVGRPVQPQGKSASLLGHANSRDYPPDSCRTTRDSPGNVRVVQEGLQQARFDPAQFPGQSDDHENISPAARSEATDWNIRGGQVGSQCAPIRKAKDERLPPGPVKAGYQLNQRVLGTTGIEVRDAKGYANRTAGRLHRTTPPLIFEAM